VSFVVRNVTMKPQRATCQVYVRQEQENNDFSYDLLAESPQAYTFDPSGSRSDEWIYSSMLSYMDVMDPTSGYLTREGSLHLFLRLTLHSQPVGHIDSPSTSELRRRNILSILESLQRDTELHSLPRDLNHQLARQETTGVEVPHEDASCADSVDTYVLPPPSTTPPKKTLSTLATNDTCCPYAADNSMKKAIQPVKWWTDTGEQGQEHVQSLADSTYKGVGLTTHSPVLRTHLHRKEKKCTSTRQRLLSMTACFRRRSREG